MQDESCKGISISGLSVGTKHHQPQSASQAVHSDALLWLLAPEEQGTPVKGAPGVGPLVQHITRCCTH